MKQKFTVIWTPEGGTTRLDHVEAEPDWGSVRQALLDDFLGELDNPDPQLYTMTFDVHAILDGHIYDSQVVLIPF